MSLLWYYNIYYKYQNYSSTSYSKFMFAHFIFWELILFQLEKPLCKQANVTLHNHFFLILEFFYCFCHRTLANHIVDESQSYSKSEVTQSCPPFGNPMDHRLPGSSVHGIFQVRVLEWAAISSSSGSSQPRDQNRVSCIAERRFTIWATREDSLRSYSKQF